MKPQSREIKSFFYSQYFSDGLRISAGILLPSLVLNFFGEFSLGISLSLGALCVSVVDTPGPVVYKRNAMAITTLCIFLVAVVTGFARLNVYTLGAEIAIITFLFSMLTVYGTRAAGVGTGALLMMVFMIEKATPASQVVGYSLTVTAGGVWYMLFSVLFLVLGHTVRLSRRLGKALWTWLNSLKLKLIFIYRILISTTITANWYHSRYK